jgi:protein AroM
VKRYLGTVTIGQAPRTDIIPDIMPILGENVEVVESGALDGLTKDEVAEMAPKKDDYVLVTRMQDGSSVTVAERYITARVEQKIQDHFDNGIPVVLLLCTGEFPAFKETGLLIRPQRILYQVVRAVAENKKLAIITPSESQIAQSKRRWGSVSNKLSIVSASPYDDRSLFDNAINKLKECDLDVIIMDCMGYTIEMQQKVRECVGKPVFLARSIVARVIKEMFG